MLLSCWEIFGCTNTQHTIYNLNKYMLMWKVTDYTEHSQKWKKLYNSEDMCMQQLDITIPEGY